VVSVEGSEATIVEEIGTTNVAVRSAAAARDVRRLGDLLGAGVAARSTADAGDRHPREVRLASPGTRKGFCELGKASPKIWLKFLSKIFRTLQHLQ